MSFAKAKILRISLIGGGIAVGMGMLALLIGWLVLSRQLPSADLLKDVQLQQSLRVYSYDGKLIAEYGEKRRIPLPIAEIPQVVKDAFLASEDDRFYEHPGVDYQGLARAVMNQLLTGDKSQGGSTITMQVARNFFLSSEKSYKRKISEILLSFRIEKELSKDQILELYLNKIYFGKRAYGIAAAAQVYYGKPVAELTLPQVAMIAGLPKAPSRYNPVVNPERATLRRNYVLRRMLELKMIPQEAYDTAITEPVTTVMFEMPAELEAPYVGEMVRAELVERFGEDIYTSGLRVYTTVDSRLQQAATLALQNGLLDYDQRHGYRGPVKQLKLPPDMTEIVLTQVDEAALAAEAAASEAEELEESVDVASRQGLIYRSMPPVKPEEMPQSSWSFREIDRELEAIGLAGNVRPALVTRLLTLDPPTDPAEKKKTPPENLQAAEIYLGAEQYGQLDFEQVKWAKPFISTDVQGPEPKAITDVIQVGDYIRVVQRDGKWMLVQLPQVEGALVSIDPQSGALLALTGGFDFYNSKFNRAVQARRQPGSSFKPFIYAAALDKGYTAASIINDAPVVFDDPALEGKWRPENYTGEFFGPTRLREGLVKSRNLVSIRLLQELGVERARRFVQRFGFSEQALPRDLSLALGSGTVTPLEMARGFAAFANDGYLINPYFIDRIENADGKLLWLADYKVACVKCFVEKLAAESLDGYEIEYPVGESAADAAATADTATPATVTEPQAEPEPATDGMEIIAEVLARSREPTGVPVPEASTATAEGTPQQPAEEQADQPEPPAAEAGPATEVVLKRRIKPATKILEPEVTYIMNSMLRDVILRGTGARARSLGRNDLAGKTGTTNDQYDAWFSGFNHQYVTTTWIGFDGFQPLGAAEAGAAASLPVWIDYMKVALEGVPEQLSPQPEGIVSMRIDAETGLLAGENTREAIFEIFRLDTAPTEESAGVAGADPFGGGTPEEQSGEPGTGSDSTTSTTTELF